uniref:Rho guanine nucleotide exchange factor 26 n=1 Tax=Acanthochromis polyacanthus TaxID=80966 RepID=A0A3Q1FLS9_9TELE
MLKHVLHKPSRKTRVVRSISIGHLSNGRFSLSKFRSEDNRSASLDNRHCNGDCNGGRAANGDTAWPEKRLQEPKKRTSSPFRLNLQKEQVSFGTNSSSPEEVLFKNSSPVLSSRTPNNNNHCELSSLSSTSSSSPPTRRTLTPSHSSTSSIPSLSSLTSSDPPTPRSPSPADRGQTPLRQSQTSSQDTRHASSASSLTSTSPSLSPSISPIPSIVLSTNSPAALKMGTQQLIPKGLASDIRQNKTPPSGPQGQSLAGLLGLDHSKRALKALSMVESGPYFSTGGGLGERADVESESPGTLKRGLRSTSYRRAVVSGVDLEVPSLDPKAHRLSQPAIKGERMDNQDSPDSATSPGAIFEVISSEHSYLHSLDILIRMFKNSAELSEAMTKTEHHHLFSNITDVCEASKKFFKELEERHQQSIVIDDISDIVFKHAQSNFDPYVTYCSNEVYQQRTLQRLVSKNPAFKEVLTRIEGHPDCRNLPMISFLILPMQRITRLPLLMDTICQKTPKDSTQYEECTKALQAVSKVVRKCNEGARTMERTEMMYTINSQLEFKIKVRSLHYPFPLVSSSRWMVKRGELTAFVEDNGIFLKRTSRQQVYFFLFNDVLIVTRKKSEESYTVIDYALRNQISVSSCQPEDLNLSPVRSTTSMLSSRQPGANHLFRLCFYSNHSGEKVPMILGTELTYTAKQPDELSLQVADVVLVSQTVEDGWYEGERLRDGERGWFLSECAEPITCQATIERNMQRMDRLQGLETNV